jgi:hypothetical protein
LRKNGNPTTFRFIATNGTHPPQTPPDYRFDDFEFFSPVIDQALIFGGASTVPGADPPQPYIRGIYSRSDRFKRLVDTNVPVPGGTGNFVFDWYGTASPILASNGIVVFGARDAADIPGLYAVRQDGGPIHKVIARGDPINGFIAQDFNVSRQGLSGNVLVFSVSYASFQGAGMYSTLVVLP